MLPVMQFAACNAMHERKPGVSIIGFTVPVTFCTFPPNLCLKVPFAQTIFFQFFFSRINSLNGISGILQY